ncbi:MAG: TetR/AcrR family transcriptional regulator [Bryobacteraceae bacterium]|nr:TetR/AcrR family transcriptional regulator [Bryobacteraceae bacterium]
MATERFQKLPPERRSSILDAAMAEFGGAGFDKGKLDNVAKAAGVTKGLLYYYFEDRDDLLATLFEHVASQLYPLLGPPPRKPSVEEFWSWLAGVYTRVVELVRDRPIMMAFVGRVMSEVARGAVPPGFADRKRATEEAVAKTVALGQKCGAIRTDLPDPLLRGAVMALMGANDRWILAELHAGRPVSVAPVLALYRSALSPAAGRRTRSAGSSPSPRR